MKAILSNMGLVMQLSGIFIIIPIILSFVNQETQATIALLITSTAFLAMGFGLNALCERKELNYKQSSALLLLVFIFLGLIGAVPYFYINATDAPLFERITDSVFESVSGYTTTGYSVIADVEALPQSIMFYRALTQFIGGIGIVLVLLAFFYPEERLRSFSKAMGIPENAKIKRSLFLILTIYLIYSIVMIAVGFLLGYTDLLNLVSFIFSALSTGGFASMNSIGAAVAGTSLGYILIATMLLGSLNFILLAGLLKLRFKEFFRSEITVFLIIVSLGTVLSMYLFSMPFFTSFFHVVSASSTTGFAYLAPTEMAEGFKILLIALMFIGGTALSTAGGIKIYRFILLFKATKKAVVESITEKDERLTLFGREYSNRDIIQVLVVVFLMALSIVVSTFIFHSYGYDMVDSLFDVTSSVSNTGMGVGVIGAALAVELKWLVTILMLLGRVEIIAFLIMLSPVKAQ